MYDPLCSCFVRTAEAYYGPNPDLKSEVSTHFSLEFTWIPKAHQGMKTSLGWARVDFQDRIASSNELGRLLPVETYAYLTEFFERDEEGTLVKAWYRSVNISRRLSDTIDLNFSNLVPTERGSFYYGLYIHYVWDMYDQATDDSA